MKILFVDDDPVIVKAMDSRLSNEGHDIFATLNPQEAVKELEINEYDLIISDIVMPYVSGIELLTEIKRICPHTPIILISALDQRELILTAFELGAQDFVVKPINLDELLLRISKYQPKAKVNSTPEVS